MSPARVQGAEWMRAAVCPFPLVVPVEAARTAQRTVPTLGSLGWCFFPV